MLRCIFVTFIILACVMILFFTGCHVRNKSMMKIDDDDVLRVPDVSYPMRFVPRCFVPYRVGYSKSRRFNSYLQRID